MINEIDLKDFKDIDCTRAKKSLYKLFDANEYPDYIIVDNFIKQVEAIQRKYTKPVAALLRADNG